MSYDKYGWLCQGLAIGTKTALTDMDGFLLVLKDYNTYRMFTTLADLVILIVVASCIKQLLEDFNEQFIDVVSLVMEIKLNVKSGRYKNYLSFYFYVEMKLCIDQRKSI